MTRAMTLLISVCFLISSCDNPKTTQEVANPTNAADNKADIGKLNDALKKYEEPAQVFKVAASKPSIITGRKGTKIRIDPADLVTESGKPVGQTIDVELKELTNQRQLLRTNAQTVSDGKLLVSGGAYFINLTSNGEQLKLQGGKNLAIRFPKLSDKEMALFYGQRNDLGQLNWQKASGIFKATQQSKPATDTAIHRNTNHANSDKADIDAIFEYIERGDTTMTPEERARAAKWEQQRKTKWEREDKIWQKLYEEISIEKFGWINCDRFLEAEDKTDLYVDFHPQDSITTANLYLVFKDINSVMQEIYYREGKPKFENLPVGYKTRLVAYTIKNEKIFAYSSDLTITKGQRITLNLKETSDKDFKKLTGN